MRCVFSIVGVMAWLFGFAQVNPLPHLLANEAEIELTHQFSKVTIANQKADIYIEQTFRLNANSSVQYLFPVQTNSTLYNLSIEYDKNNYYLDATNMNHVRNQVNAAKRRGKNINIENSENPFYIELKTPEIKENKSFKVKLNYLQDIQQNENQKSFELPNLILEHYKKTPENHSVQINLISPISIENIQTNPSEIIPQKLSSKHYTITWDKAGIHEKIKIKFETKSHEIQAGMLVYEEKGCRYILGSIEPPKSIEKKELAPREYIFVLDISGSMLGFPLETSKELITKVINDLEPNEKFNILFFAGSSDFFSEKSVLATPENKQAVLEILQEQRGKGNTELSQALQQIYRYKPEAEYNRIVVLISDGMLSTPSLMIRDLKANLPDAQYFVFGIGYELGRKNLQLLASVAGTKAVLVNDQKQAKKESNRFFYQIQSPVLRYIKLNSRQLNLNDTYPKNYNGFLSSQSSGFVTKDCSRNRNPKLIVTGINGEQKYQKEYGIESGNYNEDLIVLKYLWNLERIEYLLQEEERCGISCVRSGKYRNEIIKIGEELNISTPYTSFISTHKMPDGRNLPSYASSENSIVFQNDFDSDFDGIPNTLDDCPFDKGDLTKKGCPKTKEENIILEINRMLEGIEFDFDSYAIRPQFHEKLNTAASIIMETDVNYEVEGHTDAAGTPQYNMNLSIKRAQAVAEYLISKGVSKTRLKITGKGDTELRHPECRPQEICDDQKNFENRRVVFKRKD